MGSGRHRWKFSFQSRSPSSPSSPASSRSSPANSSTTVAAPPSEFLCPISGELMADPVIIPSGHTFERACIQACDDFSVKPPSLPSSLPRPLLLIPNSALRSAIQSWCDRESHPRPIPVSADRARHLARGFFPLESSKLEESSSSSATPDTPPLNTESNKKKMSSFSYSSSSTLSSYCSSSSYSSTEIAPVEVEDSSPARASLEDEILEKMRVQPADAVAALRRYTRESGDRAALCTPRILAALRPLLLSRNSSVQADAAAAVVNLSLEQRSKVPIVRAGIVPAIVEALRCGSAEARDHAAGALFSLAVDDENRVALGVLGAVPLLLALFSGHSEPPRARRDAGMALYHLSQAVPNKSKIARAPGAVKSLLAVAAEKEEARLGLTKVALMVLCSIAGSSDGRAAMMDAGAVAGVVGLLLSDAATAEEKEKCAAVLYGMSRGSLRFRGLAREAGAEDVLRRVVVSDGVSVAAKEMAERTMRSVRGEESVEEMMAVAADGSIVSEGVLSFPGRYGSIFSGGGGGAAAAANSAEF